MAWTATRRKIDMAKILVIDDEEDIRYVLKEVLERAGYEVDVAADASEGMDLLRANGADMVITDIIMPGTDGVQTVYDIRMEFPNTRVIVISGGGNVTPMEYEPSAISTTAYLASATAAGADLALTKPFERDELVNAVKGLLQE
jgi:CheY-like chemotaxis protein